MNILSLYRFIIRKIVLSGHNGNEYLVTVLACATSVINKAESIATV